jgi:ABC-type antimicrobial peptide transport system permease subunit
MAFAALALILAMIGLFGTLAYSVQQHIRDFGVRRALGASSGDIAWLVAASAGRLLAAGGLAGVALAMLLTRLIGTLLFGVEPLDPATYLWVGLLLAVTAMVSIAGPTWRATRVDPAIALRTE